MAERGRPSIYSQELADRICERLSQGWTLREVCRADDMPADATVRKWALDNHEGFFAQYARAREIGYMAMADETVEISDNGTNDWMARNQLGAEEGDDGAPRPNLENIARSRLRVDTRKWLLSKALPKIYGDRLVNVHEGDPDKPVVVESIKRIIIKPRPEEPEKK